MVEKRRGIIDALHEIKRSAYNGRNRKMDDEELEMVTGGLEGRLYDGIFEDPEDPYFTDDDPDPLIPPQNVRATVSS